MDNNCGGVFVNLVLIRPFVLYADSACGRTRFRLVTTKMLGVGYRKILPWRVSEWKSPLDTPKGPMDVLGFMLRIVRRACPETRLPVTPERLGVILRLPCRRGRENSRVRGRAWLLRGSKWLLVVRDDHRAVLFPVLVTHSLDRRLTSICAQAEKHNIRRGIEMIGVSRPKTFRAFRYSSDQGSRCKASS